MLRTQGQQTVNKIKITHTTRRWLHALDTLDSSKLVVLVRDGN